MMKFKTHVRLNHTIYDRVTLMTNIKFKESLIICTCY